MSEEADSIARTHGDTLATLGNEREHNATSSSSSELPLPPQPPPLPLPPPQPPPTASSTGRRPRFGTGGPPPSPYVWIDGRQLRSALAWTKKWPPRRVSFPLSDSNLVTGYLEPDNPWRHAENVNREDLIFAYKESCARHATEPLQNVLVQLENLDISQDRCEELNLKGAILNQNHVEPLEEILKRVQFNKIDLEGTSLNDESAVILFDMIEYYEAARHLNISSNPEIGVRGWQACSHMIKKTESLEQFEAGDIKFDEQNMNILTRALRTVCHLQVLKLENCGLSGKAVIMLVTALKINSGIRELYLADNGLDLYDAIQLGSLLRINNQLQLLDISNNNVQDDGVRDILEGLINQVNEDKNGKGLSILILWNNRLTKKSSPYISRIITLSKTLETLNIGQNMLTDETLSIVNESLKQNRVLLQLGMQSTELTCDGIITLAEIMETNQVLQRIDLRDNGIQMRGLHALVNVMKKNKTITQIDLDDKPRIKIDGSLHQYREMVAEIRGYCSQNEERRLLKDEDVESPQHSNRLLNASSRKISLTCQTLPSPSRSATLATDEPATRTMLEPKRTGGRLRSPAPSPIPSPVASPIPSPSRNRFVVCRVSEASLRSADSSVSSSPITPSSLGSSPSLSSSPSFSPSTSGGPSRFRVSVVESADADRSSLKSVIASSSGSSVTIGFNVRIDAADSDDPDSATKMDTHATQAASDSTTASVDMLNIVAISTEMSPNEDIAKNEDCCEEGTKGEEGQSSTRAEPRIWIDESVSAVCRSEHDVVTEVEEERLVQGNVTAVSQSERNEDITTIHEDCCNKMVNQSNVIVESVMSNKNTEALERHCVMHTNIKELQVPAYPNEDIDSTKNSVVENKTSYDTSKFHMSQSIPEETSILESSVNATSETSSTLIAESHSQEQTNTSMQKHKTNLEKLLSLFQHPGQFFSDSSNIAADTRSSLQENVNGMMALGDRLQQYLKEGRTKISADSSWSSEHGSLLKNRSMKVNVSQLQSLTNIFASFKLEPQTNLVDHGTKFFSQSKNQDSKIRENDLERSIETEIAKNDKDLFDQEKSQISKNDDKNQIERENIDVSCIFDQKQNNMKDNDNNLAVEVKNQIAEKEQKLFNRDIEDKVNLISQKENQSLKDENNLIDQTRNQMTIDERSKEKEQDIKSTENVRDQEKNRIVENNRNRNQEKDKATNNKEHDLNDVKEISVRDNENLENQVNEITRYIEKSSIHNIAEQSFTKNGNRCANKLQCTGSDVNDRLLPERVQSKDDTINNLVLDGGYAEPNEAASLLASKSTVCIDVALTNVARYSVLELSNTTDSTGCNDDFADVDRGDNAQNSKTAGRNDVERLKHDNLADLDEAKVLENSDRECVECNDAVGGKNALTARTCDTTTDSINQTSDNSFPICNIGCDRKTLISVNTTKASMNTGDETIKCTADYCGMPSTSTLDDVEAPLKNEYLNEEVTSSVCCIVEIQDRHCESTRREKRKEEEEKEDVAEVLYDACHDSADRKSTSVTIKVEPCGSLTMSSENRETLKRRNIDVHRTIVKNRVEAEDCSREVVTESKQIDPTILVTPYETPVNLDKSDADELIFCITDISTDGTSVEDELSPSVPSRSSSNDLAKITGSYYELSASKTSTSTLLIENPEVHSQDYGIEEAVLTIDDPVVETVDAHPLPPPRSSLQESVDSGIESECSSICIRVEPTTQRTLEVVVPKRPSHDAVNDDSDEYGEFASDFLAREARLIDNDGMNDDDVAHSYFNSIKCTVVGTTRPVADEAVAHPSAALHGTSPK